MKIFTIKQSLLLAYLNLFRLVWAYVWCKGVYWAHAFYTTRSSVWNLNNLISKIEEQAFCTTSSVIFWRLSILIGTKRRYNRNANESEVWPTAKTNLNVPD
jgi:hypothetical protein